MTLIEQASLVLIPSGYKEDTVYSVVPSNGSGDMSFTRASDGTRINSAGLVEVCPWNLFQQSETFENASWTKNNISVATGIGTTPEGLPYRILTNTVNGFNSLAQTPPLVIGNFYSVTIVLKKGTAISVGFRVGAGTWGDAKYNFDTDTFVGSAVALASRRFLGDGWIEIKYQNFEALQTNFRVFVSSSTTGNSLDGLIGQTLLISRMQVNIGSTAKPYFPTTDRLNVPRLTYQNGGGGCPSLLLEKQSTNIVLNSEDFSNASWGKSQCSITANNTTSPDGTQNADKLIEDATTSIHEVYSNTVFSLTSGVAYTKTIYAKSGERTQISLNFVTGGFGQGATVIADLNAGTLGTVNNVGGVTGSTATIINVGNGWYRISLKMTPVSTANFYADFSPALNGVINYAGNGTSGIYIWGAQIEASSYATSYISTTSSSATRIADACSKTGISSLIGQTEGSVFVDAYIDNIEARATNVLFYLQGVSVDKYVLITNTGGVRYIDFPNGSIINNSYGLTNGRHKFAIAYANNDFAFYIDGNLVGTDNSGTPSACSVFGFQYYAAGFDLPIKVNQAILFKTRLTNSELATLTTI